MSFVVVVELLVQQKRRVFSRHLISVPPAAADKSGGCWWQVAGRVKIHCPDRPFYSLASLRRALKKSKLDEAELVAA
jgi:hypothetical protein